MKIPILSKNRIRYIEHHLAKDDTFSQMASNLLHSFLPIAIVIGFLSFSVYMLQLEPSFLNTFGVILMIMFSMALIRFYFFSQYKNDNTYKQHKFSINDDG